MAFLAEQGRRAAMRLSGITRDDFDDLCCEMLDLQVHDVSVQLRLPRLLRPELEALRAAIGEDDDEALVARVGPALALTGQRAATGSYASFRRCSTWRRSPLLWSISSATSSRRASLSNAPVEQRVGSIERRPELATAAGRRGLRTPGLVDSGFEVVYSRAVKASRM
jgi:hypothetical protein